MARVGGETIHRLLLAVERERVEGGVAALDPERLVKALAQGGRIRLEPDRASRTISIDPALGVDGISPYLRWSGVRAFGKRFEINLTPDGSSVHELDA